MRLFHNRPHVQAVVLSLVTTMAVGCWSRQEPKVDMLSKFGGNVQCFEWGNVRYGPNLTDGIRGEQLLELKASLASSAIYTGDTLQGYLIPQRTKMMGIEIETERTESGGAYVRYKRPGEKTHEYKKIPPCDALSDARKVGTLVRTAECVEEQENRGVRVRQNIEFKYIADKRRVRLGANSIVENGRVKIREGDDDQLQVQIDKRDEEYRVIYHYGSGSDLDIGLVDVPKCDKK